MQNHSRFIGGILLIVGTSIGAGMLALPVANAATGFWYSSFYLIACWLLMTLGALYLLEVNLYLPPGKNMVSMAAATLGKPGLLCSWFVYLFLLYALLSAYISGGADVFQSLLSKIHIDVASSKMAVIFTIVFGFIVYGGIKQVDFLNRFLMLSKLIVYLFLVLLISPFIQIKNYHGGQASHFLSSAMILITSYGFAIIIPNLREYFNDNIVLLRKVVLIGSCIPLICYLIWNGLIIGSLPSEGAQSLKSLMNNPHTTSTLSNILSDVVHNPIISSFFNFFTSLCMLTAFFGCFIVPL